MYQQLAAYTIMLTI